MSNRTRPIVWILTLCITAAVALAQGPPCPGYNPSHNVNLACEIPTAIRISTSGSHTLGLLSPTLAAQLSQLPLATAVSGTGIVITRSGIDTAEGSLGPILTQRGETIGRHNFLVSFNYQHFGFDSVDGIDLKHLNTTDTATFTSGIRAVRQAQNRIDLTVNQFTAVGTFGLGKRLDVSLLVPFAKVTLKVGSNGQESDFDPTGKQISSLTSNNFLAGSATGLGDMAVNLKYNPIKQENGNRVAFGGEVRFPTGDETNFLGTGAYGIKPYFVYSHTGKKLTPNINLGYQWNSSSSLFISPTTGVENSLPSAFLYSGGADYKVAKKLTLIGEFIGQYVIDGPRLVPVSAQNVNTVSASYAMDNVGVGFRTNPFKGLFITGDVITRLDTGGLRTRILPLVGISYRFSR